MKNKGVWIKTGDTVLEINKVQLEGQKGIYIADKILKRGMQLGVNYEESFIELSNKVKLLEQSLHELKNKLGNTD